MLKFGKKKKDAGLPTPPPDAPAEGGERPRAKARPARRSCPMLLIIIAAAALVRAGRGGGAAFFLMQPKPAAAEAGGHGEAQEAPPTKADKKERRRSRRRRALRPSRRSASSRGPGRRDLLHPARHGGEHPVADGRPTFLKLKLTLETAGRSTSAETAQAEHAAAAGHVPGLPARAAPRGPAGGRAATSCAWRSCAGST